MNTPEMLERACRTHVAVVEYDASGQCKIDEYEDSPSLHQRLDPNNESNKLDQDSIQIIIVEDLSRDVIEVLGSRFDIDPHLFTGQISDYRWYNTRDPWFEAQPLELISKEKPFIQVEYVQPWYFPSPDSLKNGNKDLGFFNVLRRLEADNARHWNFDSEGSDAGIIRSKMSLWIRPNREDESGIVGMF